MKNRILLYILFGGVFSLLTFVALRPVSRPEVGGKHSASASHARTAVPRGAPDRLADALRFRTISTRDRKIARVEFARFHEFLARSFPLVHRRLRLRKFSTHSLMFTWPGSDTTLKPILFSAHQDVVPVQEPKRWRRAPFAGIRADGYIHGRGAVDDKVAVLGMLEAVESLLAAGFQPKRTIYLAFGHDEEIGGQMGARVMANYFRTRGIRFESILDEGMIIADGLIPGIRKPTALIGTAQKGQGYLELKVAGISGHSSMPPRSTAIGVLSRAITRLEKNPMPARLDGAMAAMFDELGPRMSFARRFLFANRGLFAPLIINRMEKKPRLNAGLRTTMAATIIKGGIKGNIIPSGARAVVNIRVHPRDSVAGVLAHARRVIGDERVKIRVLPKASEPSRVSPADSRPYAILTETIRQVFPDITVAPALFMASSDTRHFQDLSENIHRFRPTIIGKGDLRRVHGRDERISEKNYAGHIRFYRRLIRNATSD